MIETNIQNNRFELQMSSTLQNIDNADDIITEYLQDLDLPLDMFALRIMVRESMLNAVSHGNGENPDKITRFTMEHDCNGIQMTISDEGQGFCWQDYLQEHDGGLAESGRGLALMSLYSDQMIFNEQGNNLNLKKFYLKTELLKKINVLQEKSDDNRY